MQTGWRGLIHFKSEWIHMVGHESCMRIIVCCVMNVLWITAAILPFGYDSERTSEERGGANMKCVCLEHLQAEPMSNSCSYSTSLSSSLCIFSSPRPLTLLALPISCVWVDEIFCSFISTVSSRSLVFKFSMIHLADLQKCFINHVRLFRTVNLAPSCIRLHMDVPQLLTDLL